ncbi:MAG: hypothetical protein U0Q18_04005 [Bryobacteraceae bacterium]
MREDIVRRVMSEMGRRGGKIGGKRRLETMTPEQRQEVARKAAAASVLVRKRKAAEKRKAAAKRSKKV